MRKRAMEYVGTLNMAKFLSGISQELKEITDDLEAGKIGQTLEEYKQVMRKRDLLQDISFCSVKIRARIHAYKEVPALLEKLKECEDELEILDKQLNWKSQFE